MIRTAFHLFAAIALVGASSTAPAQAVIRQSISSNSRTSIDALAKKITDALIAGDAKRAVDAFASSSPLMTGKTIELGALQAQIQTALTAYGRVSEVELVDEQTLGTSAVRRYYVARQQNLITRWELVFSQTNVGWIVSYMGFDDQQRTWFAK